MMRPIDGGPLVSMARAAGDAPVPPLPDEDLVAVALLAARHRTRRRAERRILALTAVFALVGGAGAWALWPSQPAELARREVGSRSAASSATRSPADEDTTASTALARSTLELPTGDRMLGEGELRVTSLGAERELRLDEGEMLFDVAPLTDGESFAVVTPHLTVRVVGTVFALRVGVEGTSVEVFEGQVVLERAGESPRSLVAGQSWAAEGDWTSRWATQGRAAARQREVRTIETGSTTGSTTASTTGSTATPRVPAPLATEPTLLEVRGWLMDGEITRATEAAEAAVRRRPQDGAWRMLLGDAQRASGAQGFAAESYDAAVQLLSESRATQAGYLAAELHLERGDAVRALASLRAARATEEGSPVAERACALALRAMARSGDRQGFRRSARDYQIRFPMGAAAPWIEQELERLTREGVTSE